MVNPVQTLYLDDVDFPVKPKICYGTTKLIRAYTGNAMQIRNFADNLNHEVPFKTDGTIDVATHITPFVGAGPDDAATVNTWYDQSGTVRNAFKSSFRAPKIKNKTMGIGAGHHPAIIFEGGSQNGKAFGLDMDLSNLNFGGPNGQFTAFVVIKPTMSIHRSNVFSAGVIPNGGAVLSLEKVVPVTTVGNIAFGSQTLTVGNSNDIFVNMFCQGPAFPGGAFVTNKVGNVLTIGGLAAVTSTGFTDQYKFNDQQAKCALSGSDAVGGMIIHDRLNVNVEPNVFPVEIGPTVMCWQQGSDEAVPARSGTRMFLNEYGYEDGQISSKLATPSVYGFIGVTGTSIDIGTGGFNLIVASQQSGAGDFWVAAVVLYNKVLSVQQRAFVSSLLFDRFLINPARSHVNNTTVWGLGDSIGTGFVCLGIDGMFNRVQDNLPTSVKVRNCAVAGSQIGPFSSNNDNSASSQHIYDTMIRPVLRAGKPGKNLVVIQGGGNDTIDTKTTMADNLTNFAFTAFSGAGLITATANHGLVVGGRFQFTGLTAPDMPAPLVIGNVYWVKTTPAGNTFTLSATPGGATITYAGGTPANVRGNSLPKTGASIYDFLVNPTTGIVPKAYADGATRVFVCKLTPRTGLPYNFIIDDYNALVTAGAAANNYTVIDLFGLFPNNDNPDGTIDFVNFSDGTHLNRVGHIAAGDLITTTISPFI